jgi:hypothetical protein
MATKIRQSRVTPQREILTADRAYYVRTDGNDANNGLSDSPSGAFKTIQKALDVIGGLDSVVYNILLQIGDGTYTAGPLSLKNMAGSGYVTIRGNATTPSNVTIDGGFAKNTPGTLYIISYLRLIKTAGAQTEALTASSGAHIQFRDIVFATGFVNHMFAARNGVIEAAGNYSITGGTTSYHVASVDAGIVFITGRAITLTGTLTFGTFAYVSVQSLYVAYSCTYTGGTITGPRYNTSLNSVINTGGGGANYFPGSTAGAAATGGQYV